MGLRCRLMSEADPPEILINHRSETSGAAKKPRNQSLVESASTPKIHSLDTVIHATSPCEPDTTAIAVANTEDRNPDMHGEVWWDRSVSVPFCSDL